MKAELFTTTANGHSHAEVFFTDKHADVEKEIINLYPQVGYQEIEGFGGAITDATAYVYSLMSEAQKKALIRDYFGADGLKYRLVRTPMDSCDFSVGMYSALKDASIESFSFERTEKYILPMLRDAQAASPCGIELMLSPWSPPAFMKTNGSRKNGGRLLPKYRELWAECITRYIEEFTLRGFKVRRISVQNEPKAAQTWDSCQFTASEEKDFLTHYLAPALSKRGLDGVEIFIWDHNKERAFDRAASELNGEADSLISGIACHWYSGDHFELLDMIRDFKPELKIILSESCIERCFFGEERQLDNAFRVAHELIGDLNHGVCAFYDWNLLLDEGGGPNHVGNFCDAPYLYDRKEKELIKLLYRDIYWHFSHFIEPGAVRIGLSRYTDAIEVTAVKNPDGSIIAILLNRSRDAAPAILRLNEMTAAITIPAESIITVLCGESDEKT